MSLDTCSRNQSNDLHSLLVAARFAANRAWFTGGVNIWGNCMSCDVSYSPSVSTPEMVRCFPASCSLAVDSGYRLLNSWTRRERPAPRRSRRRHWFRCRRIADDWRESETLPRALAARRGWLTICFSFSDEIWSLSAAFGLNLRLSPWVSATRDTERRLWVCMGSLCGPN